MKPITMVVSNGADPSPGEPSGEFREYQHQKTIPSTSAELTREEHGYLYQQQKVYDDDMMYTILTKCMSTDTNICANTTDRQAIAVLFHIDSFKMTK